VVRHPGRTGKTVQALISLHVQVVFVPELVAAACAVDADRLRVTESVPIVLPAGQDSEGGCPLKCG
jgi:hypothetical protein